MNKTMAFIFGFVVISAGGWLITHTTYPAFAFMFGAWGGFMFAPVAKVKPKNGDSGND